MQTNPYTSKAVAAFLILGAIGAADAAPVGVGAGVAGSVGTVPGVIGGGAGASAGGALSGGAASGFSGSAAGAGAGSAAVGARGVPDVHANTEAFETIGMRQERLATGANLAGGAALDAPGMQIANQHAITAVLNAGPTVKEINSATVDDRDKLSADIDARMNGTAKALAELKANTKSLNAEQRAEFKTAIKETDAREKALRKSLKTARKASVETWGDSRADVAANYDAYAQAAQHAEAVAAASRSSASAAAASANSAAAEVK
jgi:hypothetical protein